VRLGRYVPPPLGLAKHSRLASEEKKTFERHNYIHDIKFNDMYEY